MVYLILFFNIFLIYLYTLFPTVAAYRDAGEFATVGYILGVPHPPGYPLYTLLIYIFGKLLIPFANFAYRINLFSAITSALSSVVLLYTFVKINTSVYKTKNNFVVCVGYFLSLVFSFGYLQWYLSLVSEMYTLNILFAILLLLIFTVDYLQNRNLIYLLFFLFGLSIANRMDIVLFMPLLLFSAIEHLKYSNKKVSSFLVLLILLFLGFSCYLYLPIRSSCEPFINWNNPAELGRFYSSLTRKTHGYTLDLISKGYAPAENFFDGLSLYLSYLIKNISIVGIIVALLGIKETFKLNIKYSLSLIFCWLLSCVYFIYKANMPPNPHAMAILEAHFLLPNTVVYTWLSFGVARIINKCKSLAFKWIIICCIIAMVVYNFYANIFKLNKRQNFYAYDYTVNIFRSVPDKSVVVIKEDVQLFSCFYRKFVDKIRPQVHIIAKGLAGSVWYQEMYKNYLLSSGLPNNVFISLLETEESFSKFVQANFSNGYGIYIAPDVEVVETNLFKFTPIGLVRKVEFKDNESMLELNRILFLFDEIYIFRGKYTYDLNWEFFSSDIIEDYSKSLLNLGHWFVTKNILAQQIEKVYYLAIYMYPILPFPYLDLGYIFFSKNMYDKSLIYYDVGTKVCSNYLFLAKKYKTSNDTVEYIKSQLAMFYLHLGVNWERLGNLYNAVECYNKSLQYNPYYVDAYYNLAVVYWRKQDWDKVRYYLSQVLRLHPQHREARYYIEKIPK